MKRAKLLQVTRPRVDLDCCYKVKKVDIKTLQTESVEEQYVRSSTCKNAFINPNFEDPIVMFDVVSIKL